MKAMMFRFPARSPRNGPTASGHRYARQKMAPLSEPVSACFCLFVSFRVCRKLIFSISRKTKLLAFTRHPDCFFHQTASNGAPVAFLFCENWFSVFNMENVYQKFLPQDSSKLYSDDCVQWVLRRSKGGLRLFSLIPSFHHRAGCFFEACP